MSTALGEMSKMIVTESSVWPQKCMYPMMLMMMRQRHRQTMSTALGEMSKMAMMTTMPAIVEAMLRVASSAMDLYCSYESQESEKAKTSPAPFPGTAARDARNESIDLTLSSD